MTMKTEQSVHNDRSRYFPEELIAFYKSAKQLPAAMKAEARCGVPAANSEKFVFNDLNDRIFANQDTFESKNIITAFTRQWVGIRQACGALSGHKLAIDAHHRFSAIEVGAIVERLKDLSISQIVYHGMASSTSGLMRGIKHLMPNVRIYGVWHGTMAGWSSIEEVNLFSEFLGLADDGIYERIGFLRQGMQHLHKKAFASILYNVPPSYVIERDHHPFELRPIRCIFPSWHNSWKNMYTNIVAAERSNIVDEIYVYSKPSLDIFRKVKFVEFQGHENHLKRLAKLDLCLNVSINDCQPMAELEGLSVGTPSLRNDWNLGLDSDSEYERHFTVQAYLNADALISKIEEISELGSDYIGSIVARHKDCLMTASKDRYAKFLAN